MSLIYRLDSLGSDIVLKTEQTLSPGDIYYENGQPIGVVMSSVDPDGYAKIRLTGWTFYETHRYKIRLTYEFMKQLLHDPETHQTTSLIFADYLEDQGDMSCEILRKGVTDKLCQFSMDICKETFTVVYRTNIILSLVYNSFRKVDRPKCRQRTAKQCSKRILSLEKKLLGFEWVCAACKHK